MAPRLWVKRAGFTLKMGVEKWAQNLSFWPSSGWFWKFSTFPMGNHWPFGWSQKWPKSPLGDSSNLDLGSLFKNPYVLKWLHFELLLLSFGAKLSQMVMVFVKPHTYLTYAKAFGWIWFQPWFSPNTVFGHFFQKRSVKNMQHPFKIEEVHTNLVANTCHVWLWGRLAPFCMLEINSK